MKRDKFLEWLKREASWQRRELKLCRNEQLKGYFEGGGWALDRAIKEYKRMFHGKNL